VQQNDEILKNLKKRYSQGISLFSNSQKKMRERIAVALFLNLCGVDFTAIQLVPVKTDPPDVIFKFSASQGQFQEDCNFEVMELLGEDTRRHFEIKSSHNNVTKALGENLSSEEYFLKHGPVLKPKKALNYETLLDLINQHVAKKVQTYGNRNVNLQEIDILMVVQLKGLFLKPHQNIFCPQALNIQQWRSLSFLMPPCCGVISTSKHSPKVLKEIQRRGLIYSQEKPEIWDEMAEKLGFPI